MKNCVSCGKELPDTAMHCVFCGGKQDAPAMPAGGDQKKTMMGYAAADLLKNIDQQKRAQGSGPPPASSNPMGPPPGGNPMGPPPASSNPMGPPPASSNPMGPPPGGNPVGPPPGRNPMGPPPGSPNPMGPPPGGNLSAAKTIMADQLGPPPAGVGSPPNPMGPPPGGHPMGPPPGGRPMGPPPGGHPMGPPPGAAATPMGPPPGANPMGPPPGANPMGPPPGTPMRPMGHPETEQVKPLSPPPYLASQTAARMDAPVDPWEGTLQMVMIVFGVVLIAAFAAPWSIGGEKTIFAFTGLGELPTFTKVSRVMIVGTGALALLMGLLPLASLPRGIAAASLGVLPVVYGLVGQPNLDMGKEFGLELGMALGMLALVAGLVLRSQYRSSMASRIMVTVGALAVMASYLVPMSQFADKPMLTFMLSEEAFGSADAKGKLMILVMVTPFMLSLVSLLAWIPAPSGAGAIVFAWGWIVWPLALGLAMVALGGDVAENLKGRLGEAVWKPAASMAWAALVGYGLATVIGKQLEHS